MAILHGNWILKEQQGHLFIWGESWRSLTVDSLTVDTETNSATDVPVHPLAMTTDELLEWWRGANIPIPASLSLTNKQSERTKKYPKTDVNTAN